MFIDEHLNQLENGSTEQLKEVYEEYRQQTGENAILAYIALGLYYSNSNGSM